MLPGSQSGHPKIHKDFMLLLKSEDFATEKIKLTGLIFDLTLR